MGDCLRCTNKVLFYKGRSVTHNTLYKRARKYAEKYLNDQKLVNFLTKKIISKPQNQDNSKKSSSLPLSKQLISSTSKTQTIDSKEDKKPKRNFRLSRRKEGLKYQKNGRVNLRKS